jgi:D-alanyl-D-alanine carboxypeptidase
MRSVAPLILLSAATLVSCQAQGQPPSKTLGIERFPNVRDLHDFAENQRSKYDWPALGVGVIYRGEIVALGVAGERKLGSGDWATLDDRFVASSCAKSMTAMVAAKLVEQGKLSWDTRVMDLLPTVKDHALAAYADVTLEQLLGHRAGLDQWMNSNERWLAWHRDHAGEDATAQRLAFAEAAMAREPKYKPGVQHYYCNDGYLIAGAMIEKVAGVPFEKLVQQTIFDPLELQAMSFGPGSGETGKLVVWGHGPGNLFGKTATEPDDGAFGRPPFGSPAGFLNASIPELLLYVAENMRGLNGHGRLLTRESFDRLHAPLEGQQYALGWEVQTTRDADGKIIERSIYHGGYNGTARANMWFCPESGWGTVIVCNDGGGDGAEMGQVFYELLKEMEIVSSNDASSAASAQ